MIYLADYGHIDFILSIHAKADVYDSMIDFFKSQAELVVNSSLSVSSFKWLDNRAA
jgi:hypothetical protein